MRFIIEHLFRPFISTGIMTCRLEVELKGKMIVCVYTKVSMTTEL